MLCVLSPLLHSSFSYKRDLDLNDIALLNKDYYVDNKSTVDENTDSLHGFTIPETKHAKW